MKAFIEKQLLNNSGGLNTGRMREEWFLKNNFQSEYNKINDLTDFLDDAVPLGIRVNLILSNVTSAPTCLTCGKKLRVTRSKFTKFCPGKCPQLHSSTQEKIRRTNLQKYGTTTPLNVFREQFCRDNNVTNVSQMSSIQEKKKSNALKKYGVFHQQQHLGKDSITKLNDKEYLTNHSISEIMSDTGVSQSHLSKLLIKNGLRDGFRSNNERDLVSYIKSIYDGEIICSDRSLIKPLELDIYIPEFKLAIEHNGVYWHQEQFKGKKSHLEKTLLCQAKEIELLHIFESEMYTNQALIWQSIIKSKMQLSHRIHGRKCTVREITNEESSMFLTKNHLQGNINAAVKIGLEFDSELVSVMTFGRNRHKKDSNQWELYRLSSKIDHTIVGGASKMFKYFVRNFNPTEIITFADRRYSVGNVYEKLGFEFECYTRPSFYYVFGIELRNRIRYQKHKLKKLLKTFDPKLTEHENMLQNGIDRIWDCGCAKFGWRSDS